jgi:GntR family transcriptional regulator
VSPRRPPLDNVYTSSYTIIVMRVLTVRVDWDHGEPVYEQIARQIRSRIAAGELRPGAPLPPVRTLASDLGVNLNTVARAYRVLEEQGFLRIRDRSGAEVAPPAERPDAAARERLREELGAVLVRMKQAGVSAEDVRRMVERAIEGPRGPAGKEV